MVIYQCVVLCIWTFYNDNKYNNNYKTVSTIAATTINMFNTASIAITVTSTRITAKTQFFFRIGNLCSFPGSLQIEMDFQIQQYPLRTSATLMLGLPPISILSNKNYQLPSPLPHPYFIIPFMCKIHFIRQQSIFFHLLYFYSDTDRLQIRECFFKMVKLIV